MKPANILRKKLDDSETALGILVTCHLWMDLIEIVISVGLDYLIVDAEHMGHDQERIADACRLGRLADFPILLRPPSSDLQTVRIAMDLGPCGLLLPMVETPEQLDAVRDGVYMPPRGLRRPGGAGNRWVSEFTSAAFRCQVEDDFIVIPQVESPLGLENALALAEHEITTALGVGPFDLSARLGLCDGLDHPELEEALATIRRAADAAGKPVWMIGDGEKLLNQGYRFVCIGEPSCILEATLKQMVTRLR